MASYSALVGTQTIANKGLNIPRQDIPNISLERNKIPPLITKLSPQANSETIKQSELKALQQPEDFNLIAAFLTHAHQTVTRSIVPSSLILRTVQDKTVFTQELSKRLIDLIHKVQQRDASYVIFNIEIN